MKLTLTIELGNSAMKTGNDIGRALQDVGHAMVTRWDGIDFTSFNSVARPCGAVRDDNGNTVGNWEVAL